MSTRFRTIAQVRNFLRSHGVEFRGIYGLTYTLSDGRLVKFVDRSTSNCWGLANEATEMVEVGA